MATTHPTKKHAPPPAGTGRVDRVSLDRALARSPGLIYFPKPLEDAYHLTMAAQRRRVDAAAIVLGLVLYNIWGLVDVVAAPDVWIGAVLYRGLALTPLYLLLAYWDRRSPHLRGLPLLVGTIASVAPMLTIYASSYYPSVAIGYLILPLSLIYINLMLPAAFVPTVLANIVFTAAFSVVLWLDVTVPAEFDLLLGVVMFEAVVLTLFAKFRMELSDRRGWLLVERDRIRAADWKDRAATLSVESHTDPLTGAANRRMLDEELTRLCQTREGCALVLLDVDHFKVFNDTFGHPVGDDVLRRLAALARDRLRSGHDLVARYGGEEFALVLPNCSLRDALLVAEHVRVGLAATRLSHPDRAVGGVTASFGVAATGHGIATPDALIAAADRALYAAKAAGRNRVHPPAGLVDDAEDDDIAWAEPLTAGILGAA